MKSVANVRHKRHKTSALHGGRNRVLAYGGTTGLTPTDNFSLTTRELLQELDVFVVDEHRARSLAVHRQRIAFLTANLSLSSFTIDTILLECRRFGHILYQMFLYARILP